MASGMHWIGSLAFALRSDNGAAMDAIRNVLRTDLDGVVLQPLNRVLDDVEPAGRIVRYKRIDVDLGLLRPDDMDETRLARRIGERLGQRLRQLDNGPPRLGTFARAEADELLSFLRTGTLAWPAPAKALAIICAQLLAMDRQGMAKLATELRPLLAGQAQAVERLVRQCPAALVHRLAAELATLNGASRQVAPIHHAEFIPARQVRQWAEHIAELASGGSPRTKQASRTATQRLRHPPARRIPHAASKRGQAGRGPLDEERMTSASSTALEESRQTRADVQLERGEVPDTLPVEAAGGVLLYPWLPGLFETASLLSGAGQFIDAEARARAVLLVHFLITGRAVAAEPDLPLAKLLCGMDLADAVPRRFRPTRRERSEVRNLLTAAISHWAALGETSIAALRETYLERPGRLERTDQDWRLTVERRGVDILLDRLPWPISLVKTPFMARPLRVDWR